MGEEDEEGEDDDMGDLAQLMGLPGGAGGPAANAPLTAADEASIARLLDLGFTRDLVLPVYLACGRDEELTANMLFDQAGNMAGDD
eukprot:NODE_3629_length_649_cov_98.396667_g2597_i0.p3 GENE.NODE_3629_length_649_cov_98.396667_g2597_i0~~NODE_3629_length_649_cov_98.396667_g2597_i0.p3  ORF type:complete len:86 (+),score=38.15 NODE_3629_length_649_cov_98.396667_g2597_i0:339-596(+)